MFTIGSVITRVLSLGASPPRPWRFRIATALVLLVMFWPISQYLRIVLRNPQRTGLLVIGSSYGTPWDINPWCEENIAALEKLDKHNLSLRRLSDPSLLAFGQWAELEDDVEHLVERSPTQQPLLVYINLHGIAAIDGQPYLLVRDSQPLDRSTWLPLDRLVQRIRQALPHPRKIVLAIESGRQKALPYPVHREHAFADAVRHWYSTLQSTGQSQGLSLLLSSSSRFGSVEHTGQCVDLFTGCLVEALSGQCDQPNYGGDGDQQIELAELTRYCHEQVEQRSRQLRGFPQVTAQFIHEDSPDFLAWTTSLRPVEITATTAYEPDPRQVESLNNLWKRIYAIQPSRPWHEEPHAWGLLKRTMVAWEQAIFGGNSGRAQSAEFERQADQLLSQLETATSQRDQSLSLEARLAQRAAKMWQQLAETPTLRTARQIAQADGYVAAADQLPAMPMLAQLLQQPQLQIWSQPDVLKRWCELEARLEHVRTIQSQLPRIQELVEHESQADSLRRELEDALLADAIADPWPANVMKLDAQVNRWQASCQQVRLAMHFNEHMLARLPTICQVVDILDALPGDNERLSTYLDQLERAIESNRDRLAIADSHATTLSELTTSHAAAEQLFHQVAQRWQRMVSDSQSQCATYRMPLELILHSGLLPIEVGSIDKAVQLRLTSHKRLAQLNPDATIDGEPHHAIDVGVRNRDRLLGWLNWTEDDLRSTRTSHESEPDCLAMHRSRIRASFGIDPSLAEPVTQWQKIQLRLRSFASSSRVLDDFWKNPQIAGRDYYEFVARRLKSDGAKDASMDFDALLQLRGSASRDGFRLNCECRPVWKEQATRLTGCRIEQSGEGLPAGLASLQAIQSAEEEAVLPLSPLIPIPVSAQTQAQTLQLPMLSSSAQSTASSVVRLIFRGHVYSSNLELQPRVGHATTGVTSSTGPARLTVQSVAVRQRARLLILDCSSSMNEPQVAEGAFDTLTPAQTPTRLDAARLALGRILEHWRGSDDHVGVLLYGHRVAMGTKEQGKLWQMRYMNRFPFSREIEAYADVETVLPPGRFGDQEYSAVVERLSCLMPWGQTPLYLAIDQATRELQRYQPTPNLSGETQPDLDVIVISDGRNYQFNPSPDKNVSLSEAIKRSKAAGVRVHVIGFGVASNELEQATAEFTQLAQQTGGSVCMELQTAMQLVEHVDSLTGPETFRVQLPGGQWVTSRCGESIDLPALPQTNTPILVNYQQTQTLVPANPRAVIRLTPRKDHLVRAQPAVHSSSRTSLSTTAGQLSPFDVVVHASSLPANAMQWQLALERRDELVAQRPKYLWLELEPTAPAAQDAPRHIVCDPMWQAETTEPVLHFITQDWPAKAPSGNVKFWCSDHLPEPLVQIECVPSDLTEQWVSAERKGESGQVQYQLQAESDGVTLVLWHGQPGEVLELMPLVEDLPGGTRVDRRYQPLQRISVHRFIHPDLHQLDRLRVAIYSVSAFKSQALRSTTTIDVSTQKEIASLPVDTVR